ncbi:MAG: hypothetical protein WKF75_15955 [Singulisphaera sp.]
MRRERETLESRMMRKYQVRFGGGLMEKGPQGYLASFLPNYPFRDLYLPPVDPPARRLDPDEGGCRRLRGNGRPGDDDKSGFPTSAAAVKIGVARYLYRDGVPGFVREQSPKVDAVTSPPEPPRLPLPPPIGPHARRGRGPEWAVRPRTGTRPGPRARRTWTRNNARRSGS